MSKTSTLKTVIEPMMINRFLEAHKIEDYNDVTIPDRFEPDRCIYNKENGTVYVIESTIAGILSDNNHAEKKMLADIAKMSFIRAWLFANGYIHAQLVFVIYESFETKYEEDLKHAGVVIFRISDEEILNLGAREVVEESQQEMKGDTNE